MSQVGSHYHSNMSCFIVNVSITRFLNYFFCVMLYFFFFNLQHNRAYDTLEFYHRLHIFAENKRTIDHHNAGNHSFTSTVELRTNSSLIICIELDSYSGGRLFSQSLSFSNLVGLNQFFRHEVWRIQEIISPDGASGMIHLIIQHTHSCWSFCKCATFCYKAMILVSCRTAQPLKEVTSAAPVLTPSL